jgi:hypothetical protein
VEIITYNNNLSIYLRSLANTHNQIDASEVDRVAQLIIKFLEDRAREGYTSCSLCVINTSWRRLNEVEVTTKYSNGAKEATIVANFSSDYHDSRPIFTAVIARLSEYGLNISRSRTDNRSFDILW